MSEALFTMVKKLDCFLYQKVTRPLNGVLCKEEKKTTHYTDSLNKINLKLYISENLYMQATEIPLY